MKEFNSINEILDFAMESEQESVDFYKGLAARVNNNELKQLFDQFAQEEVAHKEKIRKVKEEGTFELPSSSIQDLKISNYLVDVKPDPDMDYQDALILAMNKEKAAFRLYLDLSNKIEQQDMKNLFLKLAQEESRHKLRFEVEYDEYVFGEN